MNNKIIGSMGLPIDIRNKKGEKATIELNTNDFVVCRYHPNNSVYIQDAHLLSWYPVCWIKRLEYTIRLRYLK